MNLQKRTILCGILAFSLILSGCTPGQLWTPTPTLPASPTDTQRPSTPVPTLSDPEAESWPTAGWSTSTPENQGMDSQKLSDMLDSVAQKNIKLHSLLVIRHGTIVSETYFSGYQQDQLHMVYSCTKSFLSTLIGIAIDQGLIQGTDQKTLSFFLGQAFKDQDSQKESITLEDVLTMRSGLGWVESDSINNQMSKSMSWYQFVLDLPMSASPGKTFNYCSGCSHLLSVILNRVSGENTREFANKNLFKPLGITNYNWLTDSNGIPNGGWGLMLTPRDMAKLGYLYLHNGAWDGKQIVSEEWVLNSTRKHTASDRGLDYGYQWWLRPSGDTFMALGMLGQTIIVVPSLDLVVVTTAEIDSYQPIFDLIDQYVVPSIKD